MDDTDFEVPDETVVVDIDTVTNATEGTPNQAITTIIEDVLCNQNPWEAPDGYDTYIAMSLNNTFASTLPYVPAPGSDFDALLGRNAAAVAANRAQAEAFFLSEYGLDFSGGATSVQGGNIILRHISYENDYNAKINSISGYRLDTSGGDLHAGIYQAIVVGGSGAVLFGNWGGTGTPVPPATVLGSFRYG